MKIQKLLRTLALAGLVLTSASWADDAARPYADGLAHTFSIVARDAATGELGVAVQTHWFAVGRRVPWAEAGVGAIATQSFTNPALGSDGLRMLKQGKSASEVLAALLAADEGRAVRQVGIVDAAGRVAAWTGESCIPAAGHLLGDGFAVQANLMANDRVWPAMATAFRAAESPLAERMLAALEAAQAEGGDIRGRQSAALVVVAPEATGKVWEERRVDLRVDDSAEPLAELARLLRLHRAYEHMNRGDEAMEADDVARALREYGAAEDLFPEHLEMRFWHAVALANEGLVEQALPIFDAVFARDPNWRELAHRLPAVGLLGVSPQDLARIVGARDPAHSGTAVE